MSSLLDTQITQQTLERNFAKLNKYIKQTNKLITDHEVKLTEEQKERMKAIAEAVEQADRFVERRIKEINSHVNSLLVDQQEIAVMLDEEKVSRVEFTDEVNKLVQVDGENKALIQQTAQSVDTIVGNLNDVGESPYTSIAAIQVKSDQIQQTVSNHTGDISGLVQRANAMDATVADKASAAALGLTNQSISAIITELGKSPELCKYTAITMLKGLIDLCVKDTDLTGQEVIARLNISPAGLRLVGRLIEIDGETIFKNNVRIQGNLIVSGTIGSDQIGSGALNNNTVLVKGAIAHGGTIPLPDGYTQEQCIFGVQLPSAANYMAFAYVDYNTRIVSVGYDRTYVSKFGWQDTSSDSNYHSHSYSGSTGSDRGDGYHSHSYSGSTNNNGYSHSHRLYIDTPELAISRTYGGNCYYWILGVR